MTGAAYVGWDGPYSFNVAGRDIPVETVDALTYPQLQPSGQLDFTASGSGTSNRRATTCGSASTTFTSRTKGLAR